jgi:hypothetical protein
MDESVSKDAKGKSDSDEATTPDSDPAEDTATAQLSFSSDLPSMDSSVQSQETGVATESEVIPSAEQEYGDTPKPKRSWKAKGILTLDSFRREKEAEESTKEEGPPEKKPETSASASKMPSVPVGNEPTEHRDVFAPDNEETPCTLMQNRVKKIHHSMGMRRRMRRRKMHRRMGMSMRRRMRRKKMHRSMGMRKRMRQMMSWKPDQEESVEARPARWCIIGKISCYQLFPLQL